jgi:hypothetical protein
MKLRIHFLSDCSNIRTTVDLSYPFQAGRVSDGWLQKWLIRQRTYFRFVLIRQHCTFAYAILEPEGGVSTSLDAWSSSNGYSFLAIVVHNVSNEWKLGLVHYVTDND